jgi:hypothetical protein
VASWEASLKSMLSPLIFDLGTWSFGVDSLSVGERARGGAPTAPTAPTGGSAL